MNKAFECLKKKFLYLKFCSRKQNLCDLSEIAKMFFSIKSADWKDIRAQENWLTFWEIRLDLIAVAAARGNIFAKLIKTDTQCLPVLNSVSPIGAA